MNLLTLADLKGGELPALLNLCPTDARFTKKINRTIEWLLMCGSFDGTTKLVHICVRNSCIVMPPFVANLEAVRGCQHASRIESQWYRMLPGFNPNCEHEDIWFEYVDQVCSFATLCAARVLRVFVVANTDRGRKIKFLGYDKNKQWVRTMQGGTWQDGEVVILNTPFADTVTEWTSVTNVIKDETDGQVTVFSYPFGDDSVLTGFGAYQHWETKPSYQRYRINNRILLSDPGCHHKNIVEAQVKIGFVPVKADDDILPIGNRVAMELAVMGVKALDDGDLARADLLLYGNGANQRIGAVPLLNQEIRTNTGDRFAANVRVGGPCGFKQIMKGML